MESIAKEVEKKYCRFKVGLGPNKRLYICEEKDIMRYPESTLAKCLSVCKEDGRKKGDYIEIPHEGIHFGDILKYMAGDQKPLRKRLNNGQTSALEEFTYHCLAEELDTCEILVIYTLPLCTPRMRIDVVMDIVQLMAMIEYTTQPRILILNYVNDPGSDGAQTCLQSGAQYMSVLMDRLDIKQCRVIGFEGDMLGLGRDDWTQSAVVLGWRKEPKYGLKQANWYDNLIHRKCLLQKRPISGEDLDTLIDGL